MRKGGRGGSGEEGHLLLSRVLGLDILVVLLLLSPRCRMPHGLGCWAHAGAPGPAVAVRLSLPARGRDVGRAPGRRPAETSVSWPSADSYSDSCVQLEANAAPCALRMEREREVWVPSLKHLGVFQGALLLWGWISLYRGLGLPCSRLLLPQAVPPAGGARYSVPRRPCAFLCCLAWSLKPTVHQLFPCSVQVLTPDVTTGLSYWALLKTLAQKYFSEIHAHKTSF